MISPRFLGEHHLRVRIVAPARVVKGVMKVLRFQVDIWIGNRLGDDMGRAGRRTLLDLFLVLLDADAGFPWAARHAVLEENVVGVEVADRLDNYPHVAEADTMPPVNGKGANEKRVDLVRDGEDGGEESGGVSQVRLESAVVSGSRLPRVAAGNEVQEDDSQ